ncbi:MAG: GFA family protein [Caulobacteraceae bacterium]|nr:GFA family protein [Caulobacteraceae bacterium]
MSTVEPVWRSGGCHCGAVRFEVALPATVEAQACNCSMCERVGFIHLIVPQSRFRLLRGQDALTHYRFNTGVADHLFCSVCGVKSFYRPRSNPDGWSANARCLDEADSLEIRIAPFDGRDWEAHASVLAHLSREDAH